MASSIQEIRRTVKDYVLAEFLPEAAPEVLKDDTPLMTGGILDSVGIVKLVLFLEETYEMEFLAQEVTPDTMDNLADIATAVWRKIEERA